MKQDKKSGKLKLKGETGQPKICATESSFADLVAKLCEEAQESYSLLTSIAELSFTLNIDADFIDEENSATEFFGNPIELGIVPDQASGREGQSLVALLHLVFLNTETGKKWCAGFLNDDKAHKQPEEKSKRTVAEIINQSSAKTLDENRNLSTENCKNFDNLPCKPQQKGKPVIAQSDLATVALKRDSISKDITDLSVSQSIKSLETEMNNKNAPLLQAPSLPLSLPLNNMKCFLGFHVNGQAFGKVFVELCAE